MITETARSQRAYEDLRRQKLGIPPGVHIPTLFFLLEGARHGAHEALDDRERETVRQYFGRDVHASDLLDVAQVKTRKGVIDVLKRALGKFWDEYDKRSPNLEERYPKDEVIRTKDRHTPSAHNKISVAQTNKYISIETRLKFSRAKRGTHRTIASREKQMNTFRENRQSEEKKRKSKIKKRGIEGKLYRYGKMHHYLYKMVDDGVLSLQRLSEIIDHMEGRANYKPPIPIWESFYQAIARYASEEDRKKREY